MTPCLFPHPEDYSPLLGFNLVYRQNPVISKSVLDEFIGDLRPETLPDLDNPFGGFHLTARTDVYTLRPAIGLLCLGTEIVRSWRVGRARLIPGNNPYSQSPSNVASLHDRILNFSASAVDSPCG